MLYLVVAAIEVIGIFAVYRSSIKFVRYYFYASAIGKHNHNNSPQPVVLAMLTPFPALLQLR